MPFKSKAQQRFMYATMPKTAEKWAHETPNIKKLPQHVKENNMMEEHWDHPGCDDKIGKIFVVLKPTPESSPEDLVHHSHAFGMGQFNPQSVHGVYNDEEEANIVAESACNELRKRMSKMEKKKDHIMNEITKHIDRLHKEVNGHMKGATEKPEESDMHHSLAERKMARIKDLRNKHKMVKASKEVVPQKDGDTLKENSPAPSKPRENPGPAVAPGKPGQKPGPRRPLGNPDVKPKPKASISENENNIVSKIVQRYNTLKKARNNG